MKTTITNARRDFTRLLRRAEDGEPVLLTRHGRPICELRSTTKPPQTGDELWADTLRDIVHPSYLNRFIEE